MSSPDSHDGHLQASPTPPAPAFSAEYLSSECNKEFFAPGEVSGIWITFPDPKPREGDAKLRLSGLRFMNIYKRLMPKGGNIYFKTDNKQLFDHTLEVLKDPSIQLRDLVYTHDLYQSDYLEEHHGIQTTYEKSYLKLGVKINYLRFELLPGGL